MLRKLLGLKITRRRRLPPDLTYKQTRAVLEKESTATRTELARRQDVKPEILYYLAEDESAAVRQNIATNPLTPVQANQLLVDDSDDEVRSELARKIARMLPDLDTREQRQLRERTIDMLEQLAQDQLPRIRQIVAEEIKRSDSIPRRIVMRLAMDVELIVCAPVLEYSPLLNEDDLSEIIATTTVTRALTAIARRNTVSAPIADAIAATLDIPAVASLLANPNAQIREETLDRIIEHAEKVQEWHEPVIMRPSLSLRAMRRIAGFVASSLVDIMIRHHDLGTEAAKDLLSRVRRRLTRETGSDDDSRIADEVWRLNDDGALNDMSINDAIDTNRRAFVIHAVALLADTRPDLVSKMLDTQNGRVITALAWKAGLTMRTALRVQLELAHMPPLTVVNAKDGIDYPFAAPEMAEQLSYFGV